MSHIKLPFETSSSSHGRQRVGAPKPKKSSAPAKLPHITKLLALAIRLEHLLATGQVKDQAEIARTAGITRARVTQIINLTNLAPDIQQEILDLEPSLDQLPPLREGEVRQIAIITNWVNQRQSWKRLLKRNRQCGPSE